MGKKSNKNMHLSAKECNLRYDEMPQMRALEKKTTTKIAQIFAQLAPIVKKTAGGYDDFEGLCFPRC